MKKISFKKLPRDAQSAVLKLQRPDHDRFVFFDSVSLIWLLPIGVAAVWLFYLFFATQDYLWEEWMFWLFAGVTVAVILAAGFAISKLVSAKIAALKSGYIFTPNECLKTGGGCVESWNLKEIDALRYLEEPKELEMWMGNREIKIKTSQENDARRLADVFDNWKANAGDGTVSGFTDTRYSYSGGGKYAVMVVGAVICIVLAGAISFGAKKMNVSFDDRQTWKRLDAIGTVEEYENYKLRHPNGAFVAEANNKIGDTLVKLKDTYKAKTKKFADPNAVSAFAVILEEAARRPDRTVFVKINETVALDEALIKVMETKMGVKFDPFDYSIPRNGGEFRKNKMFGDLRQAFLSSMGNGAIKFEMAPESLPADSPLITVNLAIASDPNEMPYFRRAHFESGHSSLTYYAGAKFTFDLSTKGSSPAATYQIPYIAIPRDLNSGVIDRRDAANYSFDKVYFGSVSEGFGKFVEQVFGFSE